MGKNNENFPWMKLYNEILDDPKMGLMSDSLWRHTIELFLMANKENNNGCLPDNKAIAWKLHISTKELDSVISELINLGILTELPDGNYCVTNYAKRQKSNKSKEEYNKEGYQKQLEKSSETDNENKNKSTEIKTDTKNEVSENSEKIQQNFSDNSVEIQPLRIKNEELRIKNEELRIKNEELREQKEENISYADSQKCEPRESAKMPENVVQLPVFADKPQKTIQNVSIPANNQQKTKTEKPHLTPDDDAFWNVFKQKKEMAIAFYNATGNYPLSKEFGRWQKDLDDFMEAKIPIDVMIQAIEKQQADGINIYAPGSVFKTARCIMLQPQVQKPVQAKAQTWREAGEEVMAELNADNDMFSMFALPSEKQYEVIDL